MLIALLQQSALSSSNGGEGGVSSLKGLLGDLSGIGQDVPRAGVIFSGFRARFERYDELYEGGIEVPTLHVIGERDAAVTPDRSEALLSVCVDAEVLRHAGGHDIPRVKEDQGRVVEFLRRWMGGAEGEGRVSPSL
jgi:pimeloyl-ACP methyl ester carboxylesterase